MASPLDAAYVPDKAAGGVDPQRIAERAGFEAERGRCSVSGIEFDHKGRIVRPNERGKSRFGMILIAGCGQKDRQDLIVVAARVRFVGD